MSLPTSHGPISLPRQQYALNNSYSRRAKKGAWLLAFFVGFGLIAYYLTLHVNAGRPVELTPLGAINSADGIPSGERKLVLVLPVDTPSPDLCKVIASAIALGYPAPVIVNWAEFSTEEDEAIPSHLRKISGVLDFLSWATSDDASHADRLDEDDLVLMLDAHDIWLQLPPSVLIQRFFATNERANERLINDQPRLSSGQTLQTILASSQKRCNAPKNKFSELNCNSVPESPLPDNVFGFFTDSIFTDAHSNRPRYLNSGSFMGPAGDMRQYFKRVNDRMTGYLSQVHEENELSGDQGIFAEIWGEQEIFRSERAVRAESEEQFNPSDDQEADFEYHLGLDYTQELFYPTCWSENGGDFLALQDDSVVNEASVNAGVVPPRIRGVPSDIRRADAPLSPLSNSTTSWGSVPLFVDFWTTSIPVAIHHNAWKDGLKSRRTTWWDRTWFFPFLRELLEIRMQAQANGNATLPLAEVGAQNGSLAVWPYPEEEAPRAAMLFSREGEGRGLRVADWDTVCESNDASTGRWHDEVFRDGKGTILL
ncbi:hypothetical protein Q7P37_004837 [Cladosporium fusiforme]